ncbi:MAG TPA: hydroxyacylglutathione hydrolase C-terminal domain-containing protein, partial [Pseudomonadales bacterium]|nr:hydroxyacylglutathione hydrolase C-terminal domain-containing protein [Pseudomonadales bacterium]
YKTFVEQLAKLPDSTRVYPGHDYIQNNLGFTLDREPDNAKAKALRAELEGTHDPERPLVTTLALEKEINTFFRLTSPTVIARLRDAFPDFPASPTTRDVFVKLRELRNSW